jgi:hypothetical protein
VSAHRPKPPPIPVEELSRILRCDFKTGEVFWREQAGYITSGGYRRIPIGGKDVAAHHVIFALKHGRWPEASIDHINGKPLDNRPENLRECTHAQNMWNKRVYKNNKSGVKGVHWSKVVGKWVASIKRDGKTIVAGYYQDLSAAADAVAKLREQFHGDFARHATQH